MVLPSETALIGQMMNILLCGANGFIGRHLERALGAGGHHVLRGVRTRRNCSDIPIDYAHDTSMEVWLPRLTGIDAVINAVGILSEEGQSTFDALHRDTPIALFDACVQAGVTHFVQISALSGEGAMTPYMRSKREADAHLMSLPLNWVILRPSLIVGEDSKSSRIFRTLASMPVVMLPGSGTQRLQPVHIDDICTAVVNILASADTVRQVINAVGPEAMSYKEMLEYYRHAMGMEKPLFLPVPMTIMHFLARAASSLPQRLVSRDTLIMLEQGNAADPGPFGIRVGRALKGPGKWFPEISSAMLRMDASWRWLRPLFQLALALVWIATGILSLGIYPVDDSYALLAQVGLQGVLASIALYGAALLDIALGIATLIRPGRWLWRLQITIMAGYTLIISFCLPEFWLHPFGPILKNLPILALLIALDASEGK